MSDRVEPSKANRSDGDSVRFLIRWRGRQTGPYPVSVIETKLAANEIGLLHEIFHNGQWVTIRNYLAEKEAIMRAELQAREEQERRTREEAERTMREREEQLRAATLAEEQRKNDLPAAGRERQNDASGASAAAQAGLKPHRGGLILNLALIGLFVFGPLCLAAWVMGNGDLREMDAGIMDAGGRSTTSSGRNVGMLGTILWLIAVVIIFVIGSQ